MSRPPAWRSLILAFGVLLLALSGCAPAAQATAAISAGQLEAQYGLRVSQIALTAAGGLVDLRMKVIDATRAAPLLKKTPTLQIAGSDITLTAPDEGQPRDLTPVNDRPLLVLYPNSGNAVKPGTQVTVTFGDTRLEPITVK